MAEAVYYPSSCWSIMDKPATSVKVVISSRVRRTVFLRPPRFMSYIVQLIFCSSKDHVLPDGTKPNYMYAIPKHLTRLLPSFRQFVNSYQEWSHCPSFVHRAAL